jgi:TonB-dependent SusC/RagA subfamily outer membrane receptor
MNKRQLLCRLLLFFLAIVVQQAAIGQTRKISGTIKDDKGNPIAGASVETIKIPGNTTLGTVTDVQGNFALTIDASCKILRITSLSYASRELSIGSKAVFDPLIMVDGIVRDSYNDIDPNEVDNISILKDASATAVFGVRGANGVILINTKRGKEGATKISATVQTAATQFTRLPKYVNAWQYATLRNEIVGGQISR